MNTLSLILFLGAISAPAAGLQDLVDQASAGATLNLPAGVYPGPAVVDRDLTIVGSAGTVLGHVENHATLVVSNCTFNTEHDAAPWWYDYGGAVDNWHVLTLAGCTLTNNQASQFGGAISSIGSASLYRLTVADNGGAGWGGGIANWEGPMLIEDSTIMNNIAVDLPGAGCAGGGVWNGTRGTITIRRCAILNNSATDQGGGAYCPTVNDRIENCTITGNTVETSSEDYGTGGGILCRGVMVNCTVVSNSCTRGGGLSGGASLINCIVAGNVPQDIDEAVLEGGNLIGGDPRLGPLTGGVFPPLAGSPAIDAGVTVTLSTDQLGQPRVRDGNCDWVDVVDVGAYELPDGCPVVLAIDRTGAVSSRGVAGRTFLLIGSDDMRSWRPIFRDVWPDGPWKAQIDLERARRFYRVEEER